MKLCDYIYSLNLNRTITVSETRYKINDNLFISIELFGIFMVDYTKKLHSDIYTHITTIEQLKKVYFEKTSKDIELLLRKEKLKKLNKDESICGRYNK